MSDTKDDLTAADRGRFGNAETIPANPRYYANFDGDEINGKRYALGDKIDDDVDAGTLRYLVQNGRLTEKAEGDDSSLSLGGETSEVPPPQLPAVIGMDRTALLAELGAHLPDDDLRREVERKRAHDADKARAAQAERSQASSENQPTEAEKFVDRNLGDISDDDLKTLDRDQLAAVRAAEVAGRNRTTLLARIDAILTPPEPESGGELSEDEVAIRDKLVEDNDEEALRKLASDEKIEGVKSDHDKPEIATLIVLGRRAKA